MNNYQILGVDYDADEREIKRAYAKLIKEFRPDSHPTEFARIRSAYEVLLDDCRYRQQWDDDIDSYHEEEQQQIEFVSETEPLKFNEFTYDNIDSSFNLIVNKPVIDVPVESELSVEEIYERLIDKPVIELPDTPLTIELEPPKDDSFNRLIEKPVLHETIVEPLIEEEAQLWTQAPSIDIYALIQDLQAFVMPKDEHAALACFQQQSAMLASMNLDQLMDYEERLYNHLIYHDKPALLLFAAASEYFDWQHKVAWMKSAQSQWHQQRFKALQDLSTLYQTAIKRYNPYFQAEILKPKRFTTHYHQDLKTQQREQWFIACHAGKLESLHDYFAEKVNHQPIYAVDIVFGAMLGWFFAMISFDDLTAEYAQRSLVWYQLLPTLALLGSIAVGGIILPLSLCVWRSLNLTITKATAWTVGFVLIVISIRLPKGIGTALISFLPTFLLCYFAYEALIKIEIFTAKTITSIINWLTQTKTIKPQPFVYQPHTSVMNKQIYALLFAQFLSAFADNAILFTVIAMVMKTGEQAGWYIPALQSAFLVAYIVLAPWVGSIADVHAKSRILMGANIIKALGASLLLFHIEPLLAYSIVGVGAAIYSPAKYGILPELVGHNDLVKANSWIEGSTIMAILLGMKIGAMIADESIVQALVMTLALFIVSALATLWLPVNISRKDSEENPIVQFGKQMSLFFTTPRSRFAVLGGSLFWAAAASLRVMLIAWASLVLASKNANEIADLTLYLTIGIIAGSLLVPRLIPLEHLRRARLPAYLMAIAIIGLSFTTSVLSAQIVLFAVGMMGGMFVVPINAVLQEHGQQTIGSGSAVALQNFFQNLAMLIAVGAYTIAAGQHINPIVAMASLGGFVLVATLLVSLNLPKDQA
ncbi:Lysophospholipid transporter LplT [Patescibacteria group bacterium]|nr:Lysophospholipid transporter LplT [Patescibacteria group bacterium]